MTHTEDYRGYAEGEGIAHGQGVVINVRFFNRMRFGLFGILENDASE